MSHSIQSSLPESLLGRRGEAIHNEWRIPQPLSNKSHEPSQSNTSAEDTHSITQYLGRNFYPDLYECAREKTR